MDLFLKAKTIRLMSHNDKYLVAEEDRLSIGQSRDGSSDNGIWSVEFVEEKNCIRLESCYGTYLTASSVPFLPGVTAKKVVQTRPCKSTCDLATEWEPIRDGMQVRLRSLWGNFLRPNRGLPPWRNAITHDIPFRSKARDKILWDVEVVERCTARRPTTAALFVRSRSVSSTMDALKQTDNVSRMLLDNGMEKSVFGLMSCCWYPKACCVPCSRKVL